MERRGSITVSNLSANSKVKQNFTMFWQERKNLSASLLRFHPEVPQGYHAGWKKYA